VINWFSVFINALWIIGLAVLLASFSYHYWLAAEEKRPLKVQLNQPPFQKTLWLGFLLITFGLIGTSQRPWETVIWTFFALYSVYNLITLFKHS
jgi:hypothetical protein